MNWDLHTPRHLRRALLGLAAALSCLAALAVMANSSPRAATTLYSFPIPGSKTAPPQTQISFRGMPLASGAITVTGSQSGLHSGTMLPHTDGQGSSFIPSSPFTPGETVTVSGPSNIAGSNNGVFKFTVAKPLPQPQCRSHPIAPREPGDVLHSRSRPDLLAPNVTVLKGSASTSGGDIFVAPGDGPVQSGPMILSPRGKMIWFRPLTGDTYATDFRVQQYQGNPVLTWWEGCDPGLGQDLIFNSSYQEVAAVHAASGLQADLHEFTITPQNTALITAYYPTFWAPSGKYRFIIDSIVQEIDIPSCKLYPTCLVRFQWDSLDHVPPTDAKGVRGQTRSDYFHVNSVSEDSDGQLLISARDTWAAYKVDHNTGKIIWQLGGKHSSFKFGPGASFAFQHDVEVHDNDQLATIFDDGAGPPGVIVHNQSRGLKLKLDLKNRTATLERQYPHNPPLLSYIMGNVQQLPNGNVFIGWGPNPYFSEYGVRGKLLFDARFVGPNLSYRAYRFPWTGTPQTNPDIAASDTSSATDVYASWNGDTEVGGWRVLGGSSSTTLTPLKAAGKSGFETTIAVPKQNYVAVQALDHSGHVIGQSKTVAS